MSNIAITCLALARSLVGVALLALPQTTARIHFLPAPAPSSTLLLRLAGSRDLALGGLLWSASRSAQPQSSPASDSQEPCLRQALIAGVVVDAIDLVNFGACFLDGSLPLRPSVLVGAGATLFLALGLMALQSWRLPRGGYTEIK